MSLTPKQRYLAEVLGAMAVYMAVLPLAILAYQHYAPLAVWLRVLLAIAPMLPLFYVLTAVIRLVRRQDELQQRIQFEGVAFGFAVTITFCFTWFFLERFDVVPSIDLIWVAAIGVWAWALGKLIAKRRYA